VFKKIKDQDIPYPKEKKISDLLHDLLQHILDKNPKTRYTIDEIKNHDWLSNKKDLIEKLQIQKKKYRKSIVEKVFDGIKQDITKKRRSLSLNTDSKNNFKEDITKLQSIMLEMEDTEKKS
jgi:serine/threonine protein kinase